MSKIIELSKNLRAAYEKRSILQADVEELEREIYLRELTLTPAEGWPGKNAEAREMEKAKALQGDENWSGLGNARRELRDEMTLLDGTIAGLEAERRGQEWEVRANLVAMLAANAVNRNNGGPVEEEAFDDVAQGIVDDEGIYVAAGEYEPAYPEPDPVLEDHSIEDELPF